jgi:DeoR/GlpR family transcriptional regulator of sugar metabolism
MALEQEHKEKIARAAVKLIADGSSIFIGSGSTMAYLARHLAGLKRLTVVTNALNIAAELVNLGGEITVVVTGGVVRSEELSVLGHIAEQSLQEMRVDRVFMGLQALSLEGGWTTDHMPEVATTRRILDMAPELVILADHSKLDRTAAAFIAPARRITTLITDPGAAPRFVARLEAAGVKVILAA